MLASVSGLRPLGKSEYVPSSIDETLLQRSISRYSRRILCGSPLPHPLPDKTYELTSKLS